MGSTLTGSVSLLLDAVVDQTGKRLLGPELPPIVQQALPSNAP